MIGLEHLSPPSTGYPLDAIPFAQVFDLGRLIPDYRFSMRGITAPFADDLYRFLRDPLPRCSEDKLFELSYHLLPCAHPILNPHQSMRVVNPLHDQTGKPLSDPVSCQQIRSRSSSTEKKIEKKRESVGLAQRSSPSFRQLSTEHQPLSTSSSAWELRQRER